MKQRKQTFMMRAAALLAAALLVTGASTVMAQEEGKSISSLGIKDGIYTMPIDVEGGWVDTEITSPARVRIKDGKMTMLLEIDSSYYTGASVNGVKYEPEKEEEKSKIKIPVEKTDAPFTVSLEKTEFGQTAMTDCQITIHSADYKKAKGRKSNSYAVASAGFSFLVVTLLAAAAMLFLHRRIKE
ncbi:MAG: hypothetical protein K5739_06130 [Lachnospiraceae bacterium]|nr:hypothetical protein [Lachnospiraceae bacterium]